MDSRPMIDFEPQEVIRQHKPASKKGRQTMRYSLAMKVNDTLELLQLAGKLHNHKVVSEVHR